MRKQRNAVEKSMLEFSQQVKTTITQHLYAALGEAGVDRQKSIKILGVVNAAIDTAHSRQEKHFERAIDELVAAALEVRQSQTKSKG